MVRDNFACFILSHGRADNVLTLKTLLERCNYTGKWYIIIDNEDSQADLYFKNYGEDHVVMFDKYKKSLECETMDQPRKRNAVLYARNVCFETAEKLGLKYFLELDDDYTEFRLRYNKDGICSSIYVKDFDSVCEEYLDFLDTSGAVTVAMAQTGDFIGGLGSTGMKNRLMRKVMNAFFCTTERPFDFIGRMNDDVNTYVLGGMRGELFLTASDIALNQLDTQGNAGGLTDMYMENGTYVKSFFSVMIAPSCVKISEMGCSHKRIHHAIDWECCAAKIVSSRFRNE